MREDTVNLSYLSRPRNLAGIQLLIIPGSKNTMSDMGWLKQTGWEDAIRQYATEGGNIVGICGGYQMLGKSIHDPHGVEGEMERIVPGLGFLDAQTVMGREKRLSRVRGIWKEGGYPLAGYEIHMGTTTIGQGLTAPIEMEENGTAYPDGAISADGKIWGTYLHGIFDEPEFRKAFLKNIGGGRGDAIDYKGDTTVFKDAQYDLLAEHFRKNMDIESIMKMIGFGHNVIAG
jgi:adenosylcobyric acid synthase